MDSAQRSVSKQRLAGKVALITGGASGIGASTAALFARNGAKVVIADVQSDLGHSVAGEISSSYSASPHPAAATFVCCDVTKESQVASAVDGVVSAHGKLDIVFINAGVPGDPAGNRIVVADEDDLRRVFDVNVFGGFLCAKHAARVMIPAKKGGVILFTASVLTETYGFFAHAYTSSKHAVVGLMKNLCVELGEYGIRVNSISPTGVPTPMGMKILGLDREGVQDLCSEKAALKGVALDENDVAEAALFLASNESKFVSGLNLVVDGGFNLRSA
ncbi:unnamed protein product [Linum trigynum]|uniref:Uncharacterized protein n=1 Tax=Linum trigynum TaxID=586398 RepID=A0AAV2GUN3_9ROSI